MRTDVCDMFGIEFPLLAFSHCRDVVAAVTNAGGMGVLGALAFTNEQLELELNWIDEHVGGKPYGVDVVMPVKTKDRELGLGGDAKDLGAQLRAMIGQEHWDYVDKILRDHGIDPDAPDNPDAPMAGGMASGGVLGWAESTGATQIDIALQHDIALLASALGPPPREAIDRAHEQGVKVAALIGRVAQAQRDVADGVDIIIAQGYEAGGHTGEVATIVLIPDVVDAVAPVPVLAAGGIGSGRQMAAAMALGADGVWTGSIWLTVIENESGPVITEKLLAATSTDTVRSRSLTGKPARMLRTAWTDEWERPDGPGTLPMPIQPMLVADAQRRIHRVAGKEGTGANELVTYFVGQVVGSMNSVKPTRRVVMEMVDEFIDAVERLHGLVED